VSQTIASPGREDRPAGGLRSPFIGLASFTEESADYFFGRASERNVIITNLRASRLTLLYAQSGVGKSSLLRAGVVLRLREAAVEQHGEAGAARFIPVLLSSWSDEPTAALVAAVEDAIGPLRLPDHDQPLPRDDLEAALDLAAEQTDASLLVILDQFEEYFLYRARYAAEQTFADQLARCINRPDLRANFLIAVREDAYSSVGDALKGRVANVYANYLHLEYLDEHAARDAIVRPIERFNEVHPDDAPWTIEPELVAAVLVDARHQGMGEAGPEATGIEPVYLQLIMERLWSEEVASGSRVLRISTLEGLGGAQAIVDQHVARALLGLAHSGQALNCAAEVFRQLVTSRGKAAGLEAADLADRAEVPEAALIPVLDHLCRERILRQDADPGGAARYELFHDRLAPPLREWQRARLRTAAEETKSRRRRRRLEILGALLLVTLGTALVVYTFYSKNREARAVNDSIESSLRIGDNLSNAPDVGPGVAAITALSADRDLHGSFEARSAVLGPLQTNVGLPKLAVGHTRDVTAVAYFPDSATIASGSADSSIRLWNGDGRPIGAPLVSTGKNEVVRSVAVSPDGRLLAAALGNTIDLYDVADHRHVTPLPPVQMNDAGTQSSIAFSPDGRFLASGDDKGAIRVWKVADRAAAPVRFDVSSVNQIAFGPGDLLGVASDQDVLEYRFDALGHPSPAVILSKSGGRAIAYASDGAVAWSDADSGTHGVTLSAATAHSTPTRRFHPSAVIRSLAFADGGHTLVTGGDDWNVTTWDVATGLRFGPPRMAHQVSVDALAVSPRGESVAAGSEDRLMRIWSLAPAAPLALTVASRAAPDPDDTTVDIWDFAPGSGDRVAVAGGADGLVIWAGHPKDRNPRPLLTMPPPGKTFTQKVAWVGDLLAASNDASFTLYDTGASCRFPLAQRACEVSSSAPSSPHTVTITAMAIDPSARRLATVDDGGLLALWDVSKPRAPRVTWTFQAPDRLNDVAFDPTSQLLAVGGDDARITLFRVAGSGRAARLGAPRVGHQGQSVDSLAFSPDGHELASGGRDQLVRLWTVDPTKGLGGNVVASFQTDSIFGLAYSPDGKTLASADPLSVCLTDVATRRAIGGSTCLLGGNGGVLRQVAFTADGSTLLSAGDDEPVVSWSSTLWTRSNDSSTFDALTKAACALAPAPVTAGQWNAAFAGTALEGHPRDICR
jgi:WD40 repeat protein